MNSKILNIAHRGFSSQYPENTLLAFDEAMKAGADGFECDLRLTADGHVVVFHDDSLRRLCGEAGSVETLNFSELAKCKVKGKEKIPKLEELLSDFSTTRINLEIKASDRAEVLVEQVLRVLTKSRPQGEILFSSFSTEVMRCLKLMDPDRRLGRRGILVETRDLEHLPALADQFDAQTFNAPKQVLRAPWKSRWRAESIRPLWIWTVDEPDDWKKALSSELKVEALITNKPDALKAFLASPAAKSIV